MYTGRPSCNFIRLAPNTGSKPRPTHLVGFVVVLGVILEDFELLLVVEVPHKVIHSKILSPFLTVYEPASKLV